MSISLDKLLLASQPISKRAFKAASETLRVDLINAQFDLRDKHFSMIVLLSGNDLPGANDVINSLNEWLDARYLDLNIFEQPEPQEQERPQLCRYWRALPPHGRIGIMAGAWPLLTVADRALGQLNEKDFHRRSECVKLFERSLVADGTLLLKFWLHLSRRDFQHRYRQAFLDPATSWRLTDRDWSIYQHYDMFADASEEFLERTHTADAPWIVLDSSDQRSRDLALFQELATSLTRRLAQETSPSQQASSDGSATSRKPPKRVAKGKALDEINTESKLSKDQYRKEMNSLQADLAMHTRRARELGCSSVLVFEGWDAAGKGGAIRRITRAMEARNYRVIPIAAPNEEERARHYLWRFWRHLPRAGRMMIFDRSWYGRVLVERVEGFATCDQWKRAYAEINELERQLVEHGIVLCKFWLQIDAEEQLQRFNARAKTPFKKYKLTDEDYRNRTQRPLYEDAANDMFAMTHTRLAPWTLVPSNDKRFARVQVLQTIVDAYTARS